jgi:hypothetical protein
MTTQFFILPEYRVCRRTLGLGARHSLLPRFSLVSTCCWLGIFELKDVDPELHTGPGTPFLEQAGLALCYGSSKSSLIRVWHPSLQRWYHVRLSVRGRYYDSDLRRQPAQRMIERRQKHPGPWIYLGQYLRK